MMAQKTNKFKIKLMYQIESKRITLQRQTEINRTIENGTIYK